MTYKHSSKKGGGELVSRNQKPNGGLLHTDAHIRSLGKNPLATEAHVAPVLSFVHQPPPKPG